MKRVCKNRFSFLALSLLLLSVLVGPSSSTPVAPVDPALQQLQGTWEGFRLVQGGENGAYVKGEPATKVRITISGNSLHFFRDPKFSYKTTFVLPANTDPRQLHATINSPEESKGDVVISLFKVDDGTLILGGIRDPESTAAWPKTIEEASGDRYELKKV